MISYQLNKKDARKKSRGTKYQLLIDKTIYCVTVGKDIQIREWHGLIRRRLMIWFPIPGY